VDSKDGALSLRLSAIHARVEKTRPIALAAELRNNTDKPLNVLRPFGDRYVALAVGIELTGPNGPLRYTGPTLTYVLGSGAFATLAPGQVIRDKLELHVSTFAGSDAAGTYTVRYTYRASVGNEQTAARRGFKNLWTGQIRSEAVTVTRQ